MAQVKPITPVRRSRSGRPSSTGTHDIPDNAQLELLPPDLVCATSSTSSFGSLSLIGQAAGGGPAPPRMSRGQRPSSNEAGVAVRKRPSQVVQLSASRAQTPSDTSLQQSSVNSPHWTAQPTSVFSQPQSRPPLQPRPSSASAPVDPAWVQGIPMADVGSRSLSVTKPASDKQEGRGSRTSSTRTSPAGPSSQLPGSASGPKRTDPIPPHPGSSGVDPPGMRPELSKPVVRAAAWDEPADPGSISLLAAARAAKTGAVPAAACAGPGPVAAANGQGLGMLAVASCQAGQQLGTSASGELRRAAANMVPDGETPGLTASASSPRLPSPLPASTPGLISRPWTPDSSGSLLGRGSLPNSAPQLMRAHNQLLGQSTGSATQLAAQGVDEHGLQAEDAEYAKYLQSRRTTGEAAAEAQKDHFSAPPDYSFLEQAHHQLAGLAVANMPPQQQQGRGQAWQQQGQPTSRQVNRHVRVAHAAGQSPGSMRTSVDAQSTQLQQPMQRPCRAGATAGQPARPGSAGEAQGAAQGLVVSAHLTETDSGWDPVSVTSINPQDWAAVSAHRQAAVPLSPAGSAVSGRTGGASGVFFTALRRSFGAVVPGEEEEVEEEEEGGLDPTARSVVGMDAMSMRSRTNPMQEPGSSEDEADYQAYINGGDAGQASGLEGLGDGVSSEWGNPLLTPQATMAPDAEVSDASLVSMFHDLYEGTGPYTQPGPPEQLRPTPTTPSASSTAGLGVGTTGEGEDEKEEEEDGLSGREALAAAKANMLVINQAMEEQQQRCSELGEYMDQIRSKLGEDGEKLVHLPSDYLAQVEQLLMARRNEYSALQGWLGPRRFEALPINNLPDSHEDPKVAEGLHRIRQLDAKLAQAEASAIIAAREADPERWAEQEKARLARRAQAVETALKRERTKRMRSAQLVRAVAASQIMPGAMRASYAPSHTSGLSLFPQSSYQLRCFQLRPEDEALVEAVLQRDDDEAEQPTANPFLLDNSISLPVDHPSRPWTAHPSQWAGSVSLSLNGSHAAELTHVLQPPTFTTQPSTGEAGSSPDPPTEDGTASSQAQRLGQPGVTGEVEQPVHQTTPLVEAEVDLAVGLAAHTFALMRARQAAVAGLPLGVINARLDEFVHEHCWDADGSLADFSSVASSLPKPLLPSPGPHRLSSTSVLAGGVQESLVATSSGNKPVSAAAGSVGGQSGSPRGQSAAYTASGKRDYLREEREAKELAAREVDLDARIRAFKTSDPAGVRLSADQVASLVAECRHMAELAQQRKAAAAAAAMPGGVATALQQDGTGPATGLDQVKPGA